MSTENIENYISASQQKIYRKAFHAIKNSLTKEEIFELFIAMDANEYNWLFELIGNEVVQNFPNEFMSDNEVDQFLTSDEAKSFSQEN